MCLSENSSTVVKLGARHNKTLVAALLRGASVYETIRDRGGVDGVVHYIGYFESNDGGYIGILLDYGGSTIGAKDYLYHYITAQYCLRIFVADYTSG